LVDTWYQNEGTKPLSETNIELMKEKKKDNIETVMQEQEDQLFSQDLKKVLTGPIMRISHQLLRRR
jgi:hypothetical protein